MNPFDALATLIIGKIKEGLYARWLKFLFELIFSGVCTYLLVAGGTMATAVLTTAIGIFAIVVVANGAGMVAAAISMIALFRKERDGLTKGMIVALPSAEAAEELNTDLQYIEKPGEKK